MKIAPSLHYTLILKIYLNKTNKKYLLVEELSA
jgi:hypothetical protein